MAVLRFKGTQPCTIYCISISLVHNKAAAIARWQLITGHPLAHQQLHYNHHQHHPGNQHQHHLNLCHQHHLDLQRCHHHNDRNFQLVSELSLTARKAYKLILQLHFCPLRCIMHSISSILKHWINTKPSKTSNRWQDQIYDRWGGRCGPRFTGGPNLVHFLITMFISLCSVTFSPRQMIHYLSEI